MFIMKRLSQHVSGIIMSIIRRTRVCIAAYLFTLQTYSFASDKWNLSRNNMPFGSVWVWPLTPQPIKWFVFTLFSGVCPDYCVVTWRFCLQCSRALRMKNAADKSCRENQNTFYVQQFFPLKIVTFVR